MINVFKMQIAYKIICHFLLCIRPTPVLTANYAVCAALSAYRCFQNRSRG